MSNNHHNYATEMSINHQNYATEVSINYHYYPTNILTYYVHVYDITYYAAAFFTSI